jgi:hypothetical protein
VNDATLGCVAGGGTVAGHASVVGVAAIAEHAYSVVRSPTAGTASGAMLAVVATTAPDPSK